MGEARYYILARCASEEHAEQLAEKFRALNEEGVKAYNWWQCHRSQQPEVFRIYFERQFPQVLAYLGGTLPKDTNNGLAGLLDFIDEEDGDGAIEVVNTDVRGSGTVWHCADWGLLGTWLKTHGAIAANWLSDEESPDYYSILADRL